METYGGERFKLQTRDANDIDAMFIDRRKRNVNGSTLVICCEGNAGFYELGIMMTPIEANYSVLGWNHPGFGGSTGTPYPQQEQNAVDCILQFAIHSLRFDPENIVLFGWSIGGYTASWAAMNYPDLKGVVGYIVALANYNKRQWILIFVSATDFRCNFRRHSATCHSTYAKVLEAFGGEDN